MSNDYIVERRLKHHKLRRKARQGEIIMRRIYKCCRFIFVLFIFYSVYRLGATHFWYLPNNLYEEPSYHLEILGNKIVNNEKIITEMKKVPIEKEPLYKINPAELTREIEKLAPVKRAYIRRYWLPSRLVVMIEEITPAFTISPSENAPDVIAYSLTGEIIPRDYLPLKNYPNIPRILSYGTQTDDYDNWDLERITQLHRLTSLLEEYSGEKLEYLDLRSPHNAYAKLVSVRLKLGEIDESVFERIKAIHYILPEIQHMKDKIQYVDLSWKDSKYLKME